VRVRRLETDFAWAEQHPSRTRHFVTNVVVDTADTGDEFLVSSNVFVYRSRGDDPVPSLYSPFRKDTVRRTAEGRELARRWAALDQSLVNAHNMSVFF
jgi:3-phenylpropionate/cinnamic acid dioxygenase small subunit